MYVLPAYCVLLLLWTSSTSLPGVSRSRIQLVGLRSYDLRRTVRIRYNIYLKIDENRNQLRKILANNVQRLTRVQLVGHIFIN